MPKSGQSWVREFEQASAVFAPFRPLLCQLSHRESWPTADDYDSLVLQSHRARGLQLPRLRFAPSPPKPRRRRPTPVVLEDLYDGSIILRQQVPCVPESYHDLFNALVFAALPQAKHALHARQFRALVERVTPGSLRLPATRSREQDALTVFDEGGSVLVLSADFHARWLTNPSHTLLSLSDAEAELLVFGHALLEHVFYGRFQIRSCAVILVQDDTFATAELLPWVDQRLSQLLTDPSRFQAPGADAVVQLDAQGRVWLERK